MEEDFGDNDTEDDMLKIDVRGMAKSPIKFIPKPSFLYPKQSPSPAQAPSKGKEVMRNLEEDYGDNEIEDDMLKIDVRGMAKSPIKFIPEPSFLYPKQSPSPAQAPSKGKEVMRNLEEDFGDNDIEDDMLKIDVRGMGGFGKGGMQGWR